jgi:hypothetical protein
LQNEWRYKNRKGYFEGIAKCFYIQNYELENIEEKGKKLKRLIN